MFGQNHQAQQITPGNGDIIGSSADEVPVFHAPYLDAFIKQKSPSIGHVRSRTEQKLAEINKLLVTPEEVDDAQSNS